MSMTEPNKPIGNFGWYC